jgi:Tol biopolymer transport system component
MKNARADLDNVRISSDGELLSGVFCVECGTLSPSETRFCPKFGDLLADQGPDLRARLNRIQRYASGAPPVTNTPPAWHRLPIGPAVALLFIGFLSIFSFAVLLPLIERVSLVQGNIPIVPVATVIPSPTAIAPTVDLSCLRRLANMDKIAFEASGASAYDIYVASTDGALICRLTGQQTGTFGPPNWSPDGQYIVFSIGEAEESDLYVINTNNGILRRLTTFKKGFTLGPVWSPDGKSIAFVSNWANQLDYEIYVIGASGEPLNRLGIDGQKKIIVQDSLQWSADGKNVIYKVQGKESDMYYSISALVGQGGSPQPLLSYSSDSYSAISSPDGAHRAIVTDSGQLWIADSRGFYTRQLLANNIVLSRPTWSPDGKSIAVVVRDGNSTRLAMINADGSSYRLPLTKPMQVYNVAWAPKPRS